MHRHKARMKAPTNLLGNLPGRGFVVNMRGEISVLDHIHPDFSFVDQPAFEGLPRGVFDPSNPIVPATSSR